MIDPYRMVFVNIIASLTLILGVLIYRYVFPKKKINLLILLMLLSLLPLISILRKGIYESGDMSIHVKLAMGFYNNLRDGNFIPRWGSEFCGGFGCPDYLYMYALPYYIISLFHAIGLSFINSIKLLLVFSFLASGLVMYLWAKEELGKLAAFTSAIFYLFVPYHLVNMHFRVDIAEMVSFAILPLIFLTTKKVVEIGSGKWFLLQAIMILLLVISHQVIALASFPFIIAYGIFTWIRKENKSFKRLIVYFISILSGLLLSIFYWLPILVEKQYIYWGLNAATSFPKFTEFLYSPWRFGFLFQGHKGELSFIIGYAQWLVVILSVFLLLNNKVKKRSLLLFLLISFFLVFFIMQEVSKPLWDFIPMIKNFQFSYRLLVLTAFFTSVIAGITVNQINKKIFIIFLCFFAIFPTILNWGNRKTIQEINDTSVNKELTQIDPGNGDFTTPVWVKLNDNWRKNRNGHTVDVVSGNAEIIQIFRNSTKHKYIINAKTDAYIKENTFYYPGWTLKVDNKIQSINFSHSNYPGIITFPLTKGMHKIELVLLDTFIRRLSLLISIISLVFILTYAYVSKSSKNKLFESHHIKHSRKYSGRI